MENLSVDKPIEKIEEDILGRKKFIDNFVANITSYSNKESLTIGLYGKWGSGKTSIINIASKELSKKGYKTIHFNPWNFKGQDELLQCFFKEFYIQLDMVDYHKLFSKLGNFFKRAGQIFTLGKYVPVISPFATIIAPLVKEYGETLNNLTYSKSLEEIKNKISKALTKLEKKIVIFIDDVDRLNDIEICQIFQLVKLVGNFENVIYVLSMDKKVIVSALQNSQKEHAETYLEKIVQLPINIPEVSPIKITQALIDNLNKSCAKLNEFLTSRNSDFARTGFWQQFITLRDVNRFCNVFNLKFEALKDNVDFHDFCIITLLELKFPQVYNFVSNNKELLNGTYSPYERDDSKRKQVRESLNKFYDTLKNQFTKEDLDFINEALSFLFPKVWQVDSKFWGYTTYHYQEAKIRGFMYIEENFDNYFQFNENELLYNKNQIEEIIEKYNKEDFIAFVRKLNQQKQLSPFMYYIAYYVENKLSKNRVVDIINWLMEITNEIQKEKVEFEAFSTDCDRQISYILRNYLKKNKDTMNVFNFIKEFYENGEVNLVKVEFLRSLQIENGRVKSNNGENNDNPILTIEETKLIENLIKDNLQNFVFNKLNFDEPEYNQYYYLMHTINKQLCDDFVEKLLKEETNILKFIKNFCSCGQLLTGSCEKTYGFSSKLSEDFDIERIYKILTKDFNPDIDLDSNDNLYKVAFMMSYEKYDDDDQFSKSKMKKYLKQKKNK